MAELKKRWECFAQEYVRNGGNASEAYRVAYPSSRKWNDRTVWKRASELANIGEVLGRVSELQGEIKKRWSIEVDDIISVIAPVALEGKQYWEIVEDADGKTKRRTLPRSWALEQLCKILGFYAPAKADVTEHNTVEIEPLTDEEMQRLVDIRRKEGGIII